MITGGATDFARLFFPSASGDGSGRGSAGTQEVSLLRVVPVVADGVAQPGTAQLQVLAGDAEAAELPSQVFEEHFYQNGFVPRSR